MIGDQLLLYHYNFSRECNRDKLIFVIILYLKTCLFGLDNFPGALPLKSLFL